MPLLPPQSVQLPSGDEQLLQPLKDAVDGGTPALGAQVYEGGLVGEWALGAGIGLWLVGTPRPGFERRRERQ